MYHMLDRHEAVDDSVTDGFTTEELGTEDTACRHGFLVFPWHNVEEEKAAALRANEEDSTTDGQS